MEECLAKSHSDNGQQLIGFSSHHLQHRVWYIPKADCQMAAQPMDHISSGPWSDTPPWKVTIRELPAPADRNSRTSSSMLQMSFLNVFWDSFQRKTQYSTPTSSQPFTRWKILESHHLKRKLAARKTSKHDPTAIVFEQWLADADLRILFKMTWLASC